MKYVNQNSIDIDSLKHDILGLVGPLTYSKELNEAGDTELANRIHSQVVSKIETIVKDLEAVRQDHDRSGAK